MHPAPHAVGLAAALGDLPRLYVGVGVLDQFFDKLQFFSRVAQFYYRETAFSVGLQPGNDCSAHGFGVDARLFQ